MAVTLALTSDGPPKRQIIELAFGEIGIAGYEFSLTPEMINDALLRLNALMREWPYNLLKYEQPTYGVGSADEGSGISFEYLNAVSAALALRTAPVLGATLSTEAKANLAKAVSVLHAQIATIPTMPRAPHTPRGMGGRVYSGPYIEETYKDVNPAKVV